MHKIQIFVMAAFLLCLLPRAGFAETVATIQTETVSERAIYGGLGGGTGPIGAVTEFFAPENPSPFLTLGGEHAALFSSGHVYIVENKNAWQVCGDAAATSCVPCNECAQMKDTLRALDISKTAGTYKQQAATFTYSAKTGTTSRIELHKPAASGQATPYITGIAAAQTHAQAAERFAGTAFLFKSAHEKDYTLCPTPRYDTSACLVCTDCVGKEALFDAAADGTTPH